MRISNLIRGLVLPFILMVFGCETDIDLYPDDKIDEVVVYGIMDCSSSNQVIKIGRLGSPKTTDGHTLEDVYEVDPDTMSVSVQAWSGDIYGTYYLVPDQPDSLNSLMASYQGLFKPYDFMEYKLLVTGTSSQVIATAKTLPLSDPKILEPGMSGMPITFGDSLNYFEFKYSTVPRAMIYKLQMIIQYVEFTFFGDTIFQEGVFGFSPVYVDDPPQYVSSQVNYGKDVARAFAPAYLQNVFARTISPNADIEARVLYRVCFTVWAGDAVVRNYIQMADYYDDNRKQFFSNINGGYGLFASSSHASVIGLRPDNEFLTMLADGATTQELKFRRFLWTGRNGWESLKNKPEISGLIPSSDEER